MRGTLTFILIIFISGLSYSQSRTVTSLSDSGVGSLRSVVDSANAGDTIRLAPSLLSSGEHDTIFLNTEILLNKGLHFYGLDHDTAKIFVSGNSTTRIFRVDVSSFYSNISFTDYFFIDAYASGIGNGGGLLIETLDTLKLNNCKFENCEASGKGGAIYSMSFSLNPIPKFTEIKNCNFSRNSASGSSAGDLSFYMTGPVHINNCEFSETPARGSYFKFTDGLYLTNSIIRNNGDTSAFNRSSIFLIDQADTMYFNNITAYNNYSLNDNPVLLLLYSSTTILMENSNFFNNYAGGQAGVFNSQGGIIVRNCHFYDNHARWGGVTTSERATFEQCIFKGNTASDMGGVLFYTGNNAGRYATFYQCELDSNFAGGSGGSVWVTHSDFRFERSSATRNQAGGEGGAFVLFGYTGSISLLNSTIAENSASSEGGALSVSNVDSFKIKNCTFSENKSATNGNFIYFTWTDSLEIEGSIVLNHKNPFAYYGTTTNIRLISGGNNLLEFDFPGTLTSDLTNLDSSFQILDSLQGFGGIGRIMPPLPKSLAINRGNPLDVSKPQNRDMIVGLRDIGAVESLDSSIVNVQHLTVCDSVYLSGNWQDTLGLYVDTTLTSSGVDSVSYVWLEGINTAIIDTQKVHSCEPYTWIDGNTYLLSADTANLLFSTATGCDSIVYLDYTRLTTSFIDTQEIIACRPYKWIDGNTYLEDSDTSFVVLNSVQNCDSTVYLDIRFTNIDTLVNYSNGVLTASDSSAQYQWVDCSTNYSALPNATQRQYTILRNGNYAVILTKNGCTDTSACTAIMDFSNLSFSTPVYSLYPNPTHGKVRIEFVPEASVHTLKIYSSSGKLIGRHNINSQTEFEFEINQPAGIYYIETIDEHNTSNYHKLAKQ